MMLPAFAAAALAGGIAAVARYLVVRAFRRTGFPWGVLLVNVAGSGIGGVALGLALEGSLGSGWELIMLGGIAGGLTTFSTLAVDTVTLATAGDWWKAAVNVLGSFVLGVAAVCVGCALIAIL